MLYYTILYYAILYYVGIRTRGVASLKAACGRLGDVRDAAAGRGSAGLC